MTVYKGQLLTDVQYVKGGLKDLKSALKWTKQCLK